MSTELFDLPESLSPKLAWMRLHGVEAFANAREFVGMTVAETGEEVPAWFCRDSKMERRNCIGTGNTEYEAILDWCEKAGVTHWSITP